MIHVKLDGLPFNRLGATGFNWHAHEFPTKGGQCTPDIVGGHYRPFGHAYADCQALPRQTAATCTDTSYVCDAPLPSITMAQREAVCEAGDFSGKHGKLWPIFDPITVNLEQTG